MRNYENLLIFDPEVGEESRGEMMEAIKSMIEKGGEVLKVDEWGIKELAYPINKKAKGYYTLVEFSADENVLSELNGKLKLDKSVMRHSIIRKEG
jgi:small subunit ribosomal protein S6